MREKIRDLLKDIWTIPNMLTILRLVLVPVFAVLYSRGQYTAALIVFGTASITDLFDGYLARKLNQITSFGKLMDPLADKALVITALICHCAHGVFPLLPIILMLVKEGAMVIGALLLLNRNIVVYANIYGKAATCVFLGSLVAGFFHEFWPANLGFALDVVLLWISVALSYVAGVSYAVHTWRQIAKPEK